MGNRDSKKVTEQEAASLLQAGRQKGIPALETKKLAKLFSGN